MSTERKVKVKRERITMLRKGQNVFQSNGISEVKVTRIETDEETGEPMPVVVCLEIPIKSTGVSELIDTFNEKAPVAPVVNRLIEPDSEIGKELGLTKKNAVRMYDLADPMYVKAKEEHNSKLGIAIVMKGLDLELQDENGTIINDNEEKIKVLREMGLSGEQFSKLVADITSLTRWSEKEKESFLG